MKKNDHFPTFQLAIATTENFSNGPFPHNISHFQGKYRIPQALDITGCLGSSTERTLKINSFPGTILDLFLFVSQVLAFGQTHKEVNISMPI